MKEKVWLRCYKCSFSWIKEVETMDKISEFTCPSCKQQGVELYIGKKVVQAKGETRNE